MSTATVSRVLAGLGGAGAEVKQRVEQAAKDLGYRRDPVAQSLRSRRSGVVGLVVPDVTNPFFPALIRAVEEAVHERGQVLLLADSQNDVATEANRIRTLIERRVDALIVSPTSTTGSTKAIDEATSNVPVVQIDRYSESTAPYVGVDNDRAVAEVIDHLAATGRRHFAFLGYSANVSTSESRLRAFVTHAASIDPDAPSRVLREPIDAGGQVPGRWLAEHGDSVDAVVTTSDLIAVNLLSALAARGRNVPGDVGVVSFDDTILATAANLTSVRQPVAELATTALNLLQFSPPTGAPEEAPGARLATDLVVRASSSAIYRALM